VFYINCERVNNGLFTMFQNRVGDLFFVLFMLGVIRMIISTQSVIISGLVFLILGSCVKRAQFPFNSWLLAAIRAPTPISSLVHSSTLVVAGVYILLQYRYCLVDILDVLKYIRFLSLLVRSFGLLNERDMKKLIAFSTINHVSLIIYLLRLKLYKVVYFHLNVHAIFKSLIFICFGYTILVSFHAQDKRLVSIIGLNPFIKVLYYYACLCIIGLPCLRAFFSKDFIIEKVMRQVERMLFVIGLLVFLSIRIFYRMKLLQLVSVQFRLQLKDKQLIRIVRVILIGVLMIVIINIFISLVFRLRLEMLSFKIRVYWLIIIVFFLRLLVQ
jgi:NADH-ubiquinone oxidoreductase chain 5